MLDLVVIMIILLTVLAILVYGLLRLDHSLYPEPEDDKSSEPQEPRERYFNRISESNLKLFGKKLRAALNTKTDKEFTKELIETIINSEDDKLKENLQLLLIKLNEEDSKG